jgi:hypothetical protein
VHYACEVRGRKHGRGMERRRIRDMKNEKKGKHIKKCKRWT